MKNKEIETPTITLLLKENEAICIYKSISVLSEVSDKIIPLKDKLYESIKHVFVEKPIIDDFSFTPGTITYVKNKGYYLYVDAYDPSGLGFNCHIVNIHKEYENINAGFFCKYPSEIREKFNQLVKALGILNIVPMDGTEMFQALEVL